MPNQIKTTNEKSRRDGKLQPGVAPDHRPQGTTGSSDSETILWWLGPVLAGLFSYALSATFQMYCMHTVILKLQSQGCHL
jgi:hypothetical protein